MEHEISLKQKSIEALEKLNCELKERLNQAENNKMSSFEKQIELFEQQRSEMNARIDKLMQENIDKDKQLASINHQMDRKQDALDRKVIDFEQTREQLEREKKQIAEKLEATRQKLTEIQDEAMQLKLESGREQALLSQ